jgi:type IV pilus assembly protein PilV
MFRIMKHAALTRISRKTATGATLIEVMVALVILSIGLLGLASLQLSGISSNSSSEKRTQAAVVANDLIERMRANPAGVTAGNYAGVNYAAIDCSTPPATVCDNLSPGSSGCTPAQMANYDAFTSWCNASTLLQSGSLQVACTDNAGAALACATTSYRTITVNWNTQTDNGTVQKSLSMTFRPML